MYSKIEAGYCANKVDYDITINNVVQFKDCYSSINKIIKELICGHEMYFGMYRTDGMNLSDEEFKTCERDIPIYFKHNGEYREILKTKKNWRGKEIHYSGLLTVAKAQINDSLYMELPWILKYYLETTFFVPNIEFYEFESAYINYIRDAASDYITKGYTDFLFSFYDSRHFSINFNPEKNDPEQILEIVKSSFFL